MAPPPPLPPIRKGRGACAPAFFPLSGIHRCIYLHSRAVVINLFVLVPTFKFAKKSVHPCHALKSSAVKSKF